MQRYLIVETRDAGETRDADWLARLAGDLERAGADAALLLADNGVFAARAGAEAEGLRTALQAGCKVLAERYALAERGIRESDLAKGVAAVDLSAVLDAMEAGAVVVWR
jgi:predicted peroxiredoxin